MNSVALNPSSKDYAYVAARSALQDFNSSKGYKCKVESMKNIGHYKINFDIIGMPKIGIIIRNVKSFNKLKQCLKHLYHCLDYGNVSISIVIDKSLEDRVNELELLYGNEIQIVSINDDKETMVINQLIRKSSNIKYIVLLDSSVRIQDEGWLEQMLMYCQRSDVAVVGGKISYKNGKIKHAGLILDSHKIVQPIYNGSLSNYGGYFLRNRLVQNLSAVSWEFVMIKIQDDIKMLDEVYNIPLAIVNHCLKVNKEKQYVVFNPFAHSIYEGNYCKRDYHIEKMDDIANIKKFKKEWEHQLQSDPYFSKNLRVRGKQVEINVKNGVYL